MFPKSLCDLAEILLEECRRRGLRLATAESCTGGLIAACLTEIPGSSDILERGFVTYSNQAKTELLGVPAALIERHGAVSAEVAAAMAEGALARSAADLVVSASGVAGPAGGTPAKPVGLVFIGLARRGVGPAEARRCRFTGDRSAVRLATVETALHMLGAAATGAATGAAAGAPIGDRIDF